MQLCGQVELLPEGLQDGPEEVGGVEDGHRHKEEVERVSHLFPGELGKIVQFPFRSLYYVSSQHAGETVVFLVALLEISRVP